MLLLLKILEQHVCYLLNLIVYFGLNLNLLLKLKKSKNFYSYSLISKTTKQKLVKILVMDLKIGFSKYK